MQYVVRMKLEKLSNDVELLSARSKTSDEHKQNLS